MSESQVAACGHQHSHNPGHDDHRHRHDHHAQPSSTTDLADLGEKQTRRVMIIALITMFAEIGVGAWSGSLALLADGSSGLPPRANVRSRTTGP